MYLLVRIPLVAFSKSKCNTFCRKVSPRRKFTNISPPRSAQSSRPCATTCAPFEPLLNVFAVWPARWAAKSPRADPGHAEHSYLPSRDRGPPRPWPMEGRRDQGRWQAFVGGHAGRTHDQLRGAGHHHQDRRRQLRRCPQRRTSGDAQNDGLRPGPQDARAQNLH